MPLQDTYFLHCHADINGWQKFILMAKIYIDGKNLYRTQMTLIDYDFFRLFVILCG